MLDEAHLRACFNAQFSTKPSGNDNPTSCCYIDRIHNSSVLKNVSDSHDKSREPVDQSYTSQVVDITTTTHQLCK